MNIHIHVFADEISNDWLMNFRHSKAGIPHQPCWQSPTSDHWLMGVPSGNLLMGFNGI